MVDDGREGVTNRSAQMQSTHLGTDSVTLALFQASTVLLGEIPKTQGFEPLSVPSRHGRVGVRSLNDRPRSLNDGRERFLLGTIPKMLGSGAVLVLLGRKQPAGIASSSVYRRPRFWSLLRYSASSASHPVCWNALLGSAEGKHMQAAEPLFRSILLLFLWVLPKPLFFSLSGSSLGQFFTDERFQYHAQAKHESRNSTAPQHSALCH